MNPTMRKAMNHMILHNHMKLKEKYKKCTHGKIKLFCMEPECIEKRKKLYNK
jgi:hypothetical protein